MTPIERGRENIDRNTRVPELRLTVGLPGSGKSQYAMTLLSYNEYLGSPNKWRRINWDNMRYDRGMHLRSFKREEEEKMQNDAFLLAETYAAMGWDVIVDNTNLSENTRNKWKGVAQRAGMNYNEVWMDPTLEECIKNDEGRKGGRGYVGRAVIERMALFAGLIKFRPEDRIVLVDMDGTMADCTHRRPYIANGNHDWNKFESDEILKDPPIFKIINLVKMLNEQGYIILVVSGRPINRAGFHTVDWLKRYGVPYRHIFMRQGGDHRQDNIIKKERELYT
jgi:predicted kinase